MSELRPPPAPELRSVLDGLVASAADSGVRVPPWIAVDDGASAWIRESLCRPPIERARAVALVGDELALARAAKLGFGGAALLPPSTPAVVAAFAAAAEAEPVMTVGECAAAPSLLLELPGPHVLLVHVRSRLWRRQLGLRRMGRRLGEAATELEVAGARLPGPALLLAGLTAGEVSDRLDPAVFRAIPLDSAVDDVSLLSRLVGALSEKEPEARPWREPVFQLPEGRRVGWWQLGPGDHPGAAEWIAWPEAETRLGHVWRVRWPDGRERVVEDALPAATLPDSAFALRIPGWVCEDLRRGSPAGVLVELAARRTARIGLPLWLPQVEPESLHLLLRLGATIWVDGPAAPGV